MRAVWNGAVLAESDDTVAMEGNQYFPEATLRREHLRFALAAVAAAERAHFHWNVLAAVRWRIYWISSRNSRLSGLWKLHLLSPMR